MTGCMEDQSLRAHAISILESCDRLESRLLSGAANEHSLIALRRVEFELDIASEHLERSRKTIAARIQSAKLRDDQRRMAAQ